VLIYDHNKQFVGIDEESLKLLGYERFEDLLHEHKDIAELFVKKPGYIHNFTNFPWIDFVLHAESDVAKVIVAGKQKAFSANITIANLRLDKAPNEVAYLIKFSNIQNYQLDASERPESTPPPFDIDAISFNEPKKTIQPEPFVQAAKQPEPVVEAVKQPEPFEQPVYEQPAYEEPVYEEPVYEEPSYEQQPLTIDEDLFMTYDEVEREETIAPVSPAAPEDHKALDIYFDDEDKNLFEQPEKIELPPEPKSVLDNLKEEKGTPMLGAYLTEQDKAYLENLEFSDNYVYNPNIAADELGLPVDLIEEFIGDFIKQSYEFKDQLFIAIKNGDFDTIKVLSHKLKGVAANLRIEDSFEVLRNVNESADINECEANLKKFYITIAKLEGKDIESAKQALEQPIEEIVKQEEIAKQEEVVEEEELYDLTPKFGTPQAEDTSDLYDFGLLRESSETPFIAMDDEEDILADIHSFQPQEKTIEQTKPLNYDIKKAAAEIGLNPDLVGALIDDYIVEANEMKNKLSDAIAASDVMRWKGYATQLKGVSDNLRIVDISNTLQNLAACTEQHQAKALTQEFYAYINQL